jgi:hypothetical protein
VVDDPFARPTKMFALIVSHQHLFPRSTLLTVSVLLRKVREVVTSNTVKSVRHCILGMGYISVCNLDYKINFIS